MQCKFLQETIFVNEDEEQNEFENPIELEYYLVESVIDNEDFKGIEVYGIEIVKRINDEDVESELVRTITFNRENAMNMLYKFVRNKVTPVNLIEIVDDLISI